MVCISVLSWRQSVIISLPSEPRVQKACNFWPFYSLLPSSSFFHFVGHFLVFRCSYTFPCHTWKTVWWIQLLCTCSMVCLDFSVLPQPALLHTIFFPFPFNWDRREQHVLNVKSLLKPSTRDPKRSPLTILPLKGAPNLLFSKMWYNRISRWVVFSWGESSLKNSFLLKGYWISVIKK